MNKAKLLINFVLGVVMILSQVKVVSAAPSHDDVDFISGTVYSITLETNANTGGITLLVVLVNENDSTQTVRISQETASDLGLISWDEDGNPVINEDTLGQVIDIDSASAIPDDPQTRHPVGNALATFFSDIEGIDYDTIMSAHEDGHGFGVIAQVLWLTRKLPEGDSSIFIAILKAKKEGDFSSFVVVDGTSPVNWGQFKKVVLDGDKKINLGSVISGQNNDVEHGNAGGNSNGSSNDNGNNKNKDKETGKDKEKDGKGNEKKNKP